MTVAAIVVVLLVFWFKIVAALFVVNMLPQVMFFMVSVSMERDAVERRAADRRTVEAYDISKTEARFLQNMEALETVRDWLIATGAADAAVMYSGRPQTLFVRLDRQFRVPIEDEAVMAAVRALLYCGGYNWISKRYGAVVLPRHGAFIGIAYVSGDPAAVKELRGWTRMEAMPGEGWYSWIREYWLFE